MTAGASDLRAFLEDKVQLYNQKAFVAHDPVCIPHLYSLPQDVEIAGFLSATLAWGQRKTIINKCRELMQLMDHSPYAFVMQHSAHDLKALLHFKHRTFTTTDLLYFIQFLKELYARHTSMEDVFLAGMNSQDSTVEEGINAFRSFFISLPDYPARSGKHVASPARKSACKRINMFLRWMVRQDDNGVDFGLWQKIKPSQLVCPCDLHVERVARHLGLLKRKQLDWQAALELTHALRQFDAQDPVKYDFALFGIGAFEQKTQGKFRVTL
jgi:uncharacterized protein (TIGR02757 family)